MADNESMSSSTSAPAVVQETLKPSKDLDHLVEGLWNWQKATRELQDENYKLTNQFKIMQKRCVAYEQAQSAALEDKSYLHNFIDQFQGTLTKRCDVEDENKQLKEQLRLSHIQAVELEQQHYKQMTDAMEDLRAQQDTHKREITRLQENSNRQMKKEIENVQKVVQDKTAEIRQLQKQQADSDREKHTEIVKLRLEYDAKLLKMQKQASKSQTSQSSVVSNDIFRRKLQYAKAESEKEIKSLRKRVGDLERQLMAAKRQRQ